MANRVSQAVVEVVLSPTSVTSRVSQAPIEVVHGTLVPVGNKLSQVVVEAVTLYGTPDGRVTQAVVEPLVYPTDEDARTTQVVVEPLVYPTTQNAKVTQLCVEVLVRGTVVGVTNDCACWRVVQTAFPFVAVKA